MTATFLHDDLATAAATHGDRPAVRAGEESWSFADLDRLSDVWAHHFASLGVGHHDRVALMLGNRPGLLVAVEALSRLGAAAVLLSPAWKATEVEAATTLTSPIRALGDGQAVALLGRVLGEEAVVDLDDPIVRERLGSAVPEGIAVPPVPRPPDATPDDEVVLVFSSGTTGLPKAVRHTHASLLRATDHWVRALGLTADDRFQVATPPTHILGLLNLLAAIRAGATVRLHPRFDIDAVLQSIQDDGITLEMAVAPIALALSQHPDLERYDLSSLRYIMWGATPVTESVAETITARCGVRWLPAYGASELPVLVCNPVDEPDRWRLDSAGLPPDEVDLRVVDLDTGAVLAPGGIGEIQARSPSLMAGYLPAEATAEVMVDGWYRTGDVGWLEPEGWVHITDRSKEMIKVKGFQVAPAEVEAVLHSHPAVVDCAVFGIPDEVAGEVPVAAVQLAPGSGDPSDELTRLVTDSLASYKQLRHLVVVDSVPRLPSGKVLRRTLRYEWAPRLAEDGTSA